MCKFAEAPSEQRAWERTAAAGGQGSAGYWEGDHIGNNCNNGPLAGNTVLQIPDVTGMMTESSGLLIHWRGLCEAFRRGVLSISAVKFPPTLIVARNQPSIKRGNSWDFRRDGLTLSFLKDGCKLLTSVLPNQATGDWRESAVVWIHMNEYRSLCGNQWFDCSRTFWVTRKWSCYSTENSDLWGAKV